MTYARGGAAGGWGTLVLGGRRVGARIAVLGAGIAVWLGAMLIATGAEGVVALWTNALFLGGLLLAGMLTVSVSLRTLLGLLLAGGGAMGLMFVASGVVSAADPGAEVRDFVIPLLEETFKLAPILYLLWRWRRRRQWALGATDLLLMGAASGVGFGLIEDAYIRHHSGWPDQVGWLPVTEIIGQHLIVGHGIWTAIAGAGIGIGLLLRSRGRLGLAVAAGAFSWAAFDHTLNNVGVGGGTPELLVVVTADGWLSLWFFLAAAVVCIGADLWVLRDAAAWKIGPARAGLASAWSITRRRRALAYAGFQQRACRGGAEGAASAVAYLTGWLARRLPPEASAEPAASMSVAAPEESR